MDGSMAPNKSVAGVLEILRGLGDFCCVNMRDRAGVVDRSARNLKLVADKWNDYKG
jgi:hypothetical protein